MINTNGIISRKEIKDVSEDNLLQYKAIGNYFKTYDKAFATFKKNLIINSMYDDYNATKDLSRPRCLYTISCKDNNDLIVMQHTIPTLGCIYFETEFDARNALNQIGKDVILKYFFEKVE